MRLLFIRHGDPDYEHDSLTEKGMREAELLAARMQGIRADAYYVSPLGRAQKTAQPTLVRNGRSAQTLDWLREFVYPIVLPETGEKHLIWDFMPAFMQENGQLYSAQDWMKVPFIAQSDVPAEYNRVCDGIDSLLAEYGYRRAGTEYETDRPNKKTLVFFCHFGATGVILSHLLNFSPVAFLQHFAAAPTSVTTVFTEERERGKVSFRCTGYGDVSHLYAVGEPPSFSARFCETFEDTEERH